MKCSLYMKYYIRHFYMNFFKFSNKSKDEKPITIGVPVGSTKDKR